MNFILFGRSRSGTTITYNIIKKSGLINITNQSHKYLNGMFSGGDKTETPRIEVFEKLNKKGFYFIHIFRDGRDSVASGIRMNKVFGPEYRPWKDKDLRINSKHWSDAIDRCSEAKKLIDSDRFLELRFEDCLDYPGRNASLIAKFLNLDEKELLSCEKALIDIKKAHKSYYADLIPKWEKEFHHKAIENLRKLGYLKEN